LKPLSPHWADQTAARVARKDINRSKYTVASGITPSGTVHIGNFREVITVDLVARALLAIGKEVRFIYSWDDFDTFRKVPVNRPKQDMLKEQLRKPICRVPDPYEETESYAAYNIKQFENEITELGIKPEFLYQHKRYGDGLYAEHVRKSLEEKDKIKDILDKHRTSPLPQDWLPTAIYCEACGRDEMDYQSYPGDWSYAYKCTSCGDERQIDIRKTKNLKLNWRTDWPMRWAFEEVDFEPGGKDHSSEGGSFATAKQIVKTIWNHTAPEYLQYDFVSIKGGTGKMSSSSGELISLSDALAVYEPQLIRWIFANQRPNHDFSIAFDQDVIKIHDEFDRAEATALGPKPEKPGKWPLIRRTYELSCVNEVPKTSPYRAPYRELCNRLQIFDGDSQKTLNRYYKEQVKTDQDQKLFIDRCERAWNWLTIHAPEEFRYQINLTPPELSLSDNQAKAIDMLKKLLSNIDLEALEASELNQKIYDDVIRGTGCDAKDFFQAVYQKLISRDKGPRLPSFLKEIGHERLMSLL